MKPNVGGDAVFMMDEEAPDDRDAPVCLVQHLVIPSIIRRKHFDFRTMIQGGDRRTGDTDSFPSRAWLGCGNGKLSAFRRDCPDSVHPSS